MRVFTNTAVSLDGRIATVARDHVQVGTDEDRRRMSLLRAQADAVLVGGQTFRAWPYPLIEIPQDARERHRPMVNAVLTRGGLGAFDESAWTNAQLMVLTGPDADVAGLKDTEVITHPEPSPTWALDVLAARGCESILVEGGGDLIFQLLDAGRIDEVFVTICPRIIGGLGAPTLADGRGFDADTIRDLTLVECTQVGDELYAHYRVVS